MNTDINYSDLITTTIGAFIGGLFSYWIVKIQLKYAEKAKEEEQVANIAAWLEGRSEEQFDDYLRYNLVINNSSKLPIYNVLVLSLSNKKYIDFKDIIHWDERLINYYPLIVPGIKEDIIKTHGGGMGGEYPSVSLLFTDVYGKHRYRNQMGQLKQLSTKEYDKFVKRLGYRPPL